jgi:arylsulfatase A-like enzyme
MIGTLVYNGLWDDTIFIVTSDHGEEFGEHGGERHGYTCYRESTHVPLLLHVPGLEGQRITQPVALVDIVPTVLELIGADAGGAELDGQSLLIPPLAPAHASVDRPIFCRLSARDASRGTSSSALYDRESGF